MKTAGLVLAGGKSSRYGRPKMFEQLGGKPFYEFSVQALAGAALHPVIVSTNELLASRFHPDGIELLIEADPYNGPLFAIRYAFQQYPDIDWFFVLSADIPFVTSAFIEQLLLHRHPAYNAIVPVHREKKQPLLALYHRRCLPAMESALQSGRYSLMALLEKTSFKEVPFSAEDLFFININTPEDLTIHKQTGL